MRVAALIVLFTLAGCQTDRIVLPKLVRVPVPTIVDVPAELTRDCDPVPKKENTYGEAVRLANARAESLAECSGRMKKIRELKR